MATTWRLALKLGLSFALAEVTWNTKPHKRADKDPQNFDSDYSNQRPFSTLKGQAKKNRTDRVARCQVKAHVPLLMDGGHRVP
jgi:hypothetical protein